MTAITKENIRQLELATHRVTMLLRHDEGAIAHEVVYNEIMPLPTRVRSIVKFLSTKDTVTEGDLKVSGYGGEMDMDVVKIMSLDIPGKISVRTHICKWIINSIESQSTSA